MLNNTKEKNGLIMKKCIFSILFCFFIYPCFTSAGNRDDFKTVPTSEPSIVNHRSCGDGTCGGKEGSENGEFRGPSGIAADSAGNIYVADTRNDRIQKFDRNGKFIAVLGSSGTGEGNLGNPGDVAVDADGNVYVDTRNFRIQKFDKDGNYAASWGPESEIGSGFIREPVGIAVDSAGNVYVADAWQSLILKYDANGNFITAWEIL